MIYSPFYRYHGYDPHARMTATQAESEARLVKSENEILRQDIERLLMITEALWNLMKEQHGHTDEELTRRIEDIDLQDGVLDGRVAETKVDKCPRCKRPNSKKRALCLYCGEPLSTDPFAR